MPAGVDVTAYRVVQDALAAAVEQGRAGRAEVRVRFGSDAVEVEVRDDGRSPDPRPLLGMRERVALHGGSLTALPRPEGGHVVRAELPLGGDAPADCPVVEHGRRIARELHDLVAHSMSVMVVQAGGARRILDHDPARALEAATRIERTGREALAEMRHLLGVLNGSAHPLAPQPTLAEIGELVARARAAGLPTALELRGTPRPLPAGLDLAAYRIIQEALTNALKHAGHAPTTVTVDFSEHALAVEIRDRGRAAAPAAEAGHGLVGMRERVRLYGGELEAGPADDGGWRVRARLPLAVRQSSLAS